MPSVDDEQAQFDRFIAARDQAAPNDSGQVSASQLPDELRGLNWGGLLLNFAWAML